MGQMQRDDWLLRQIETTPSKTMLLYISNVYRDITLSGIYQSINSTTTNTNRVKHIHYYIDAHENTAAYTTDLDDLLVLTTVVDLELLAETGEALLLLLLLEGVDEYERELVLLPLLLELSSLRVDLEALLLLVEVDKEWLMLLPLLEAEDSTN